MKQGLRLGDFPIWTNNIEIRFDSLCRGPFPAQMRKHDV